MQKLDVSIIIVNFNTRELTRNCLASIFEKTEGIEFEVIVSDNGSSDGSVEMIHAEFPQVILIENGANLGFGAANNRGLKIARGRYIFYLNSDTVLLNNAVKYFFEYFEKNGAQEKIGALGSWLLDEEGNIIHSGGNFPTYKATSHYLFMRMLDSLGIKMFARKIGLYHENINSRPERIDYITGADLFLRNDEKAKFDEQFFMYFEESDLQFQLSKLGLERKIIEEPKIIHLLGGSEKMNKQKYSFNKRTAIFYWENCLKYFKKHIESKSERKRLRFFILLVYFLPWNFFNESKGFKRIWSVRDE